MRQQAEHLQPAFTLVDRLVAEEGIAGAALAVAQRGALIASHYAGEAAPGHAAEPETLWPLASISKLYTAATVVALVERGVLALSTPVRRVLPVFEGGGRERITIRHLLTHTSGVIHEPPELARLLIAQTPLDAIVDEVYRAPLSFAPGEGQAYSDLGFALLGRIAATVACCPFPDLVRELVLKPAGLEETDVVPEAEHASRLAYVSGVTAEGTDGAMYNSSYARSLAHPAFTVVATLADIVRFGLCFAPGGRPFLSAAAVGAMTTDQAGVRATGTPGAIAPWGLGFELPGAATSRSWPRTTATATAAPPAASSGSTPHTTR